MAGLLSKPANVSTQPRPAGGTGRARRAQWEARLFVSPAVLLVAVLLYLPFLWTAYLSFTAYDGLGSPHWIGLANYREFFHDPVLRTTLRNTVLWVVGTVLLPVTLGLVVAVATHDLKRGWLYRLPFVIPYTFSGVSIAVVWGFILQHGGAANTALEFLGVPGGNASWLVNAPANTIVMIIASTWQGVGVNALLFVIGLQSIPKEPIEAARLDGAKGWSLFRSITWPLLRPLTTVVVGLALVASLKTFDIVWVMTEGGPGRSSETLAVTMYRDTFVAAQYGYGATIAVLLTVITAAASILYLRRQLRPGSI